MLPSWLRQLFKKRFVGQGATRPIRTDLKIESLEDRTVPTVWTWTGNAIAAANALLTVSSNPQTVIHNARWSNANNWTDGASIGIPLPGDDVIFPTGLDAAHKPPATGSGSTFSWPVNSEIDLWQDGNGFHNFDINNL